MTALQKQILISVTAGLATLVLWNLVVKPKLIALTDDISEDL